MLPHEFPASDAWSAIFLWVSKPSAYNKSVATSELINLNAHQSPDPLEVLKEFFRTSKRLQGCTCASVKSELGALFREKNLIFEEDWDIDPDLHESWIAVRLSVPKSGIFGLRWIDVVICDFDVGSVQFLSVEYAEDEPVLIPQYTISYDGSTVRFQPNLSSTPGIDRIRELFFSKIAKWTRNPSYSPGTQSLCLINQEEYYVLYNSLKKKYCQSVRNIWEEATDPEKFIHEDVAIATYLILVWGKQPQTFVDLGCGNGLLVYILCSEGHEGHGIDVRARKIWKSYPPGTILKEETIVPSPTYTFTGVDWIIGNHSDELTPWIPVISLLSSATTNFFLLPCCAYEFNGVKFRRTNTSKSQYMDYLDYVESICRKCGFIFSRDRLKIPSTKRICFVSRGRAALPIPEVELVHSIINGGNSVSSVETPKIGVCNANQFLSDIKTRDSVEKVRNCTQLDRNFVSSLVSNIADLLLTGMPPKSSPWNAGTPLEISTVASKLSKNDLLQLKNECGGLQTFLRNHHFVFMISEGKVSLRKPEVSTKRTKSWKTKPCWFYANHPQSCPLDNESCSFLHVDSDP